MFDGQIPIKTADFFSSGCFGTLGFQTQHPSSFSGRNRLEVRLRVRRKRAQAKCIHLMLQQLSFKWAVAVIYPGRLMIHDH